MNNIQDLAQRFIDALHALEQGDESEVEGLVALFAPDTRITNAALQLTGKEEQGHDGARLFWSEYKRTLGECFSKFHHVTVDARCRRLFWTTEGTGPDGNSVRYDGVSLLEFNESGTISFFRGYYDTRDLTVRAES
jgi:ketosteroid isomerase-like protein